MAFRIQFESKVAKELEVIWFQPGDATSEYYDFCGGGKPLTVKWGGDRYSPVRGSEITFQVIMQSDEDKRQLDTVLNGGFYVCVRETSGGVVYKWTGKLFPQYFNEPYRQYPYTISLNASDQLGQLKNTQPLMIDYPEPFNKSAPSVNIITLFNNILTSPQFKPDSEEWPNAPDKLRVSARLFQQYFLEGRLFESVHLDPLAFMNDDEDTYISNFDILERILEPLYMKLFQWDNIWYVMSYDAQYNNGALDYREFDLGAIPSFNHAGTLALEMIDPYNPPTNNPNPKTKQVFNNTELSYLPAWYEIDAELNYKRNTNVIPSFANRSGNFYYGSDGTQLEFDISATALRHWDQYGAYYTQVYDYNDGILVNNVLQAYSENNRSQKNFTIDVTGISGFNILLRSWAATYYPPESGEHTIYVNVVLKMNIAGDTTDYYFWDNEGDFNGWSNQYRTWQIPIGETNIQTALPNDFTETSGTCSIELSILSSTDTHFLNQPLCFITGFEIYPIYNDWEIEGFTVTENVGISPIGTKLKTTIPLHWGLYHLDLPNSHDMHLTAPYTQDGEPIHYFAKSGGDPDIGYRITDWLRLDLIGDNNKHTTVLNGSWFSTELTPLNLIYDYEGRIYQFTSGEYDAREMIWSSKYTQVKWIDNDRCDFSPYEFNNDFCTEII